MSLRRAQVQGGMASRAIAALGDVSGDGMREVVMGGLGPNVAGSGFDSSPGAGDEIYAQFWSHDPQSPSHSGLSNAVRFLVSP